MDEPSGKYFDFMAMFKDVKKDLFTEYRIYRGCWYSAKKNSDDGHSGAVFAVSHAAAQ